MRTQDARQFSRRRFLGGVTLAGMAGLLSLHARRVAAEPPPETTRLRIVQAITICYAPQYIAEELLHSEGFAEVHYIRVVPGGAQKALDMGEVDLTFQSLGSDSSKLASAFAMVLWSLA
jgi:NitT/TauT family transport system substrate-binding protein